MKKTNLFMVAVLLVFVLGACGQSPATAPDVSPTPAVAATQTPVPGMSGPGGQTDTAEADQPTEAPPAEGKTKSDLYDPSIFIIEAKGTGRQELAPGYYADFECELYADKVDGNDNRHASGLYNGVVWMNTKLDTGGYLKDLLKNVPVEMSFDAGGEGVCDNLVINLRDDYEREAWEEYAIEYGGNAPVLPSSDASVAKGGFIAMGREAYLAVQARGAQGEQLEYENNQASDAEFSYVLHIEGDPTRTATERKVTIHLYNAQGLSVVLDGVWRRIPGTLEDSLNYEGPGAKQKVLRMGAP